jgi:hypothetical protein
MIERAAADIAIHLASKFPVLSVTGPRQSGKSTLCRSVFPSYDYVSLENEDDREFALNDPREFLRAHAAPCIIDEAQLVPHLFSYLQGIVDATGDPGQYILSGSQNFLLNRHISQSLAGRVGLLDLLPLSYAELEGTPYQPVSYWEWLFKGGYPRIYDKDIEPYLYYPAYVRTYLERDVRQESGVVKLDEFERFLGLAVTRCSQVLKKDELAREAGVSSKTVENWISVLDASYITTLVQPFFRNYGKRLVKSPKLYFLDTGLASNMLGMTQVDEKDEFGLRGMLFEAAVLSELYKASFNRGMRPDVYYWRDSNGREVDFVVARGPNPYKLVEVKSSTTFSMKFFDNLDAVGGLMGVPPERRIVVYAGEQRAETGRGVAVPLSATGSIMVD